MMSELMATLTNEVLIDQAMWAGAQMMSSCRETRDQAQETFKAIKAELLKRLGSND